MSRRNDQPVTVGDVKGWAHMALVAVVTLVGAWALVLIVAYFAFS